MKRFAGRTVLLTGSTGGIGQAVARRFHAEGAALVLVDLDMVQLRAQAQTLGEGVRIFAADVSDAQAVDDFLQHLMAGQGRIEVGILNAGTEGAIARLKDQRLADFERVMAVNVRRVFLWLAGLMRLMRRQGGGALAVTSSTAGLQGASQLGPYVASKHACWAW